MMIFSAGMEKFESADFREAPPLGCGSHIHGIENIDLAVISRSSRI
jgi:hypothetical protein